ncbi:MAG TPA: superoxide dismutase [Acidimicrobiales bacterium]
MSTYTLPDLPYDHTALEPHIDARIMELHHGKHHAAYVDQSNKALEQLAEARSSGDFALITKLSKDLAFNLSGHVLHTVFWTCMSPDGGGAPEGDLAAAIDDAFGSFDDLKAQLTEATKSVQGSGWGALAWEPLAGRLIVEQVYDHQSNIGQGSDPILVIDAWEHAFYLQYLNDKAAWVDAFWEVADWQSAAVRFKAVQATGTAAR